MKVLLFDPVSGGHHPAYLLRLAEALSSAGHEVVMAAPRTSLDEMTDPDRKWPTCEIQETPPVNHSRSSLPGSGWRSRRTQARSELDTLRDVASRTDADHVIHMYADPVISALGRTKTVDADLTVIAFFPRVHYRRVFGARLPLREYLYGLRYELAVRRFRRRADAHAVLSLDEFAVASWNRRSGARAHWLPEPPCSVVPRRQPERSGCVLYGSLSPRKGIDLLVDALLAIENPPKLTLAGTLEPGYSDQLEHQVARLRRAGVEVSLRAHRHSEQEGLDLLGAARCAVLPYPSHRGMSRVLLEAAAAGTPVVAPTGGLMGALTDEYKLGTSVDVRDAASLGHAIKLLADGPLPMFQDSLAAFAERYSKAAFEDEIRALF